MKSVKNRIKDRLLNGNLNLVKWNSIVNKSYDFTSYNKWYFLSKLSFIEVICRNVFVEKRNEFRSQVI